MASITLLLFNTLKMRIIATNKTDMPICVYFRFRSATFGSLCFTPKISTENEVVSEANAESELAKVAAIIPITNKNVTTEPKYCAANSGKISSDEAGKAMLFLVANISNIAPNVRNNRFSGTYEMPYQYMFFLASRRFLQVRFFCIIS